eukprot:3609451-Prymnesium_polylepis.2
MQLTRYSASSTRQPRGIRHRVLVSHGGDKILQAQHGLHCELCVTRCIDGVACAGRARCKSCCTCCCGHKSGCMRCCGWSCSACSR